MVYTSKLKEWGATADEQAEFPDGYRYTKENPPVTHYDNFLVYNLIEDVQHLINLTNLIDSDNDGQVDDAETVQGKAPEQLGGFKFIQSSNPNEVADGTTWFKNSNGLLFIADGTRYEIRPEVGYDETSEFGNSDGFTLIHESPPTVDLDGGSLKLINEQVVADFESGISPNHSAWSWSDTSGITHTGTRAKITSNGSDYTPMLQRDVPVSQDIEFSFEVDADTSNINDESIIRLDDENGNHGLEIKFNDGAGSISLSDSTELLPSWTAGQTYVFEINPDFDAGTVDITIDGSTVITDRPITATGFSNIWFGSKTTDSGSTRSVYVDDVHTGAREYGEVVISCPKPDSRIEGWDLLRFDRTLDGESVVVDVEDEAGTTLISNIQSNDDLSVAVDAATNPQIRVTFSRENTTNNPSFDYLYRRWYLRPGDNGLNVLSGGSSTEENIHEMNFESLDVSKDGDGRVTINGLDNEEVRDIIGAMAGEGIDYDDANDALNALTDEEVEDLVGGMASNQLSYDDSSGTINVTEGHGSGLDSDTLDGKHASDLPSMEQLRSVVVPNESNWNWVEQKRDDSNHSSSSQTLAYTLSIDVTSHIRIQAQFRETDAGNYEVTEDDGSGEVTLATWSDTSTYSGTKTVTSDVSNGTGTYTYRFYISGYTDWARLRTPNTWGEYV